MYKRRERFSGLSIKIGIAFSKLRISPNQWTLLSIIPALIAMYFLANSQFIYAAVLFILSSFMDLIDGSVARITGKASRLGAYMDTIVDRYVEGIIIFAMLFASLPDFYIPVYAWIFLYMFGSLMTTYSKSAAKEKELIIGKELKGGLLERAERLIILFIGILLAVIQPIYLTYVIVILAVLSNISAIQRIVIATKTGSAM
jgi:archaetidylinositol phosphate synthase